MGQVLVPAISAAQLDEACCRLKKSRQEAGNACGSSRGVREGSLFGRRVAVKVRDQGGADESQLLLREIEVQSKVRCAHLVPAVAVCPERYALVYPWAAHGSLRDFLSVGLPAPGQALQLLLGATNGLLALHQNGLVHNDVRSTKVLLFQDVSGDGGDPNADMVAQLSLSGRVQLQYQPVGGAVRECLAAASGKAEPYLDPVSALSGHSSTASDIFSLGVVFLEVLLGRSAASASLDPDVAGPLAQTRRLRPKHLWAQFREKLVGQTGEHPEASAILQMLPLMTWGEETLQMLAPLVARMLTVSTELPQETQLLAPPPPLETLQAPTWPAVPSRPSALEVAEGLDVALALQAAAAVDDEDQRERICVVCMDAPVDARLQPCLHAALCATCASLFVAQRHTCPICRGAVQGFERGEFQKTFAFGLTGNVTLQ